MYGKYATFTDPIHNGTYEAISPLRAELSQAGKTILISGGTTGIGYGIARGFVKASAARVIITGRRAEVVSKAVANLQQEADGTEVVGIPSDVSNAEAVNTLWDGLKSGGIVVDVLVLSAVGFPPSKPLRDVGTAEIWKVFDINVRAQLQMTEQFDKQEGKGSSETKAISVHDFNVGREYPGYALTKHSFQLGLQLIAQDTPPEEIQIISYNPGAIFTENAQEKGYTEDSIPWDHVDLPGHFAVWAASPEAKFLHGRFVWATWLYEALSYVWGPLEFRQKILVEENSFGITENLQCALQHLRHGIEDRIVWVDAICINQGDIAERNHQVTLMKEIYSRCTRDLAWLGPNPGSSRIDSSERGGQGDDNAVSNKNLKRLQNGMRIFSGMYHHDAETLDSMLRRWQSRQRFRAGIRDKTPRWILSYDDEKALMYLFREAPLWTRIWVMQELSCANNVLLIAGTETLDWEDVALFLGDDNKPYADAFHVTGGHSSLNGAVVTIFGVIQTIQQQRRIMRDVDEGKYESKLIDVLARFRYADSRDPRDVIYGLLGLVSELHPVRVDYGKTTRELFADVTKFFIDSSGNLDIVCQNPWVAPRPKDKDEAESLPSWMVDFKNERRFTLFTDGLESMLFAQRGIFSAGSPTCVVPCEVFHDGLLSTRGVILDKLGPVLRGDPQTPALERDLLKLMELYFEEGQLDDDSSAVYTPTGEPLFRAFWRTIVMDCKAYPIRRLAPEDIEADEKIFRALAKRDTFNDTPEYHLVSFQMLMRASSNWVFAMSKTGLLLKVSKEAQEDDILAILDGGKVPCLLRPFHESNELRCRMIHSVYIHGYMDGRVASMVEEGRLLKRDILLA
ncbi:hypothetical protein GQX73_g9865 [Xylaria multiplex]|uniref:Heterokaryon incompatibility domain-containing protein n=1 Tax=Xylaria multiplex TaxID=323545 RepID=A0A7C8MG42_9PEZI|nr:hypothetical protein GQX73_g9865 [Xylaria multiplex]